MTSKSAAALTSLTPARPGQASLVGEHDELGASQWTRRLAAAHLSGKLQAELTAPETVIQLPVADAVELTELLQFIYDWLATCHDQLREPLARFVGHPAYDISQLRADLQRLAFLLGADNEDQLFGQ